MKIKDFLIAKFFSRVGFLYFLSVSFIGNSYESEKLSSCIAINEGDYLPFIIILSFFVLVFLLMNLHISVKYYNKKKRILFCLSILLLIILSRYFISGVILPFLNSGTDDAMMGPLVSIFGVYIYILIVRLFTFGGGYRKPITEDHYMKRPDHGHLSTQTASAAGELIEAFWRRWLPWWK